MSIGLPALSTAVPKGAAGKVMAAQLQVLGYSMNLGGLGLMYWCWTHGVLR